MSKRAFLPSDKASQKRQKTAGSITAIVHKALSENRCHLASASKLKSFNTIYYPGMGFDAYIPFVVLKANVVVGVDMGDFSYPFFATTAQSTEAVFWEYVERVKRGILWMVDYRKTEVSIERVDADASDSRFTIDFTVDGEKRKLIYYLSRDLQTFWPGELKSAGPDLILAHGVDVHWDRFRTPVKKRWLKCGNLLTASGTDSIATEWKLSCDGISIDMAMSDLSHLSSVPTSALKNAGVWLNEIVGCACVDSMYVANKK
jgi:hypothetical protein